MLGQGDDLLVVVFAIGFGRGEGEVETVALLLAFDILLKTRNQLSYSKDKLKRLTRTGLLDFFNFWCFVGILRSFVACQLIRHGYMLALFDDHNYLYIFLSGAKILIISKLTKLLDKFVFFLFYSLI